MGMKTVILGGGIAGLTAAETLRRFLPEAEIVLVDKEQEKPYIRPLLSKARIRAFHPEKLYIHPENWYEEQRITLKTGLEAVSIDPLLKTVAFSDGSIETYDKLICALGADPFIPPIPGKDLPGVYAVRTIRDIRQIHRDSVLSEHAVIIGGGIIGAELAFALKEAGLQVTMLEREYKLAGRMLDDESAEVFKERLKQAGIGIRTRVMKMAVLAGPDGRAAQVEAEIEGEGKVSFPAELVIISCGVKASAELLKNAGAKTGRGIVVNRAMETSLPDILACGDCIDYEGRNPGLFTFAKTSGMIAGLSAGLGASSPEVKALSLSADSELIFSGRNIFLYAFGDLSGRAGEVSGEEGQ